MAMSRLDGCSPATSLPAILISPPLIGSRPAMVLSSVDLPQPDGPTSTRKPPCSISSETSLRMRAEPKDFSRFLICRNDIGL